MITAAGQTLRDSGMPLPENPSSPIMMIRSKQGHRLQTKMITSFVVAGILPLIMGLILTFWVFHKVLEYSTKSNLQMIAREVSARVSERMDFSFRILNILKTHPLVEDFIVETNRNLEEYTLQHYIRDTRYKSRRWMESSPGDSLVGGILENDVSQLTRYIHGAFMEIDPWILLTDNRGTLIAASGKEFDYYLGDESWWRYVKRMGEKTNYYGEIAHDAPTGTFRLPIATAIVANGEFAGALRADLDITSLFPFILHSRIHETGHILLVDEDGRVLLGPPHSPFTGKRVESCIVELKKKSGWFSFRCSDPIRTHQFVGYSIINFDLTSGNPGEEKKWYVLTLMDADEAFQTSRFLLVMILVYAILLSSIFCLLSIYQAHRIVRPIHELQRHIEQVDSGSLGQKIYVDTDDETQALAEAFNKMAERLKELYHNLEIKVAERTQELVKINEELKLNQARLQEVDKLKSEFLSHMSHELKTPLSSIIGFSELLLDEIPGRLNDGQRENLLDILSSGEYLLKLISDILDYSRAESGKIQMNKTYFDFVLLVEDIKHIFSSIVKQKNQEIIVNVEDDIPPVFADEGKIRHVILNLFDNAVKYSPDNAPVRIHVCLTDERWKDDAAGNGIRQWLRVTVEDEGKGIARENLSYIFDEFWRMSGEDKEIHRGGAGLGLALCKKYIQLHGGEITVQSEYGIGSRFDFYLPV